MPLTKDTEGFDVNPIPEDMTMTMEDDTPFPPVCIIGSKGKMGAMLAARLNEAGYEVHGVDRRPDEEGVLVLRTDDVARALAKSKVVVLCVPVSTLKDVLAMVAPRLRPAHVLMDITSVKTLPMQWMEEAFSGRVVGTHPLFGPTPVPEDMRVVLVRGKKADVRACQYAAELFTRFGCDVLWASAQEHDEGVGVAQSLNFTVSAAFFCGLARHPAIRHFLTPSFKRHLEAARKHLTMDTAMFLEFTAMNPEYPAALEEYCAILGEVAAGNLPQVAAEAASWYAEKPANNS